MNVDDSTQIARAEEPIAPVDAIEQAKFLCGQLAFQIAIADAKAAYTLGGAAILVTVASADSKLLAYLFDPSKTLLQRLLAVLTIIMFALLLWSVADSLICTLPAIPRPKRSNLFYFVSVQDMTEEAYRQAFLQQPRQEVETAIINQAHILSTITYRKYVLVRRSLYVLLGAFAIWLLIGLLQII